MGLFDGMAGVLNEVFGAPVLLLPRSGSQTSIQAVLRHDPIEVTQDDGRSVLISAPTLRVPEPLAADINRDDHVVFEGVTYMILNKLRSASPASDRFVLFELEECLP